MENINTRVREPMAKSLRILWSMKKYTYECHTFLFIYKQNIWISSWMLTRKKSWSRDCHIRGSSTIEITLVSIKCFIFFLKISNPEPGLAHVFGSSVTPLYLAVPAGWWQCLLDEQAGAGPRQLPFQPDSCISQVVWHLRWRLWIRLKVF